MRNIKLTIEYDGTDFAGWQTQPNGHAVQDVLEAAVAQILAEKIKIIGSGRTDAGVHARGQVANFLTVAEMDVYRLRWSVNAVLPDTIAVTEAKEVSLDFDARRQAKSRTYSFYIWNEKYSSPFFGRYSWWVARPLELFLMNRGAEYLIGAHNFAAFTTEKDKNTVRKITVLEIEELSSYPGRMIRLNITADSFLHHLVRMIAGTLVEIGLGNIAVDQIGKILSAKDIRLAGPKAPAKGLFLERVDY